MDLIRELNLKRWMGLKIAGCFSGGVQLVFQDVGDIWSKKCKWKQWNVLGQHLSNQHHLIWTARGRHFFFSFSSFSFSFLLLPTYSLYKWVGLQGCRFQIQAKKNFWKLIWELARYISQSVVWIARNLLERWGGLGQNTD